MWHLILGALMLASAALATLVAADALEQIGRSHAVSPVDARSGLP